MLYQSPLQLCLHSIVVLCTALSNFVHSTAFTSGGFHRGTLGEPAIFN